MNAFIDDYMLKKYIVEKSGWRTLSEIANQARVSPSVLYGRNSKIGQALDEPVRRGLIEIRYSPGERGRGGEVMRVRLAYDKEPIRDYVNSKIRLGKSQSQTGTLASVQLVQSKLELDKHRVAVLPFANISPDPNDEYFAEGMTEELITVLSQIRGLRVIAKTTVDYYKKSGKPLAQIGQELGVGTILEGSIRKAGNKIRATAQLIDAKTQVHEWSEKYDRTLDDIFAIQSEIAQTVADALKIQLLPAESSRIQREPTKNTEAYTLYLKGRYEWNKRTEEGLKSAIEFFQKAIEIDPRYAQAYSGMADSYLVLAARGQMREALPKGTEYATKALEIDDNTAEAHTSFAMVLRMQDWDWAGSEREFKRAIEINPSYATAHHWYGVLLRILGRFDESIYELNQALELDPLSLIIGCALVCTFTEAGQYDKAIEYGKRLLEMEPNFATAQFCVAGAYSGKKMYTEAIRHMQAAVTLDPGNVEYKAFLGCFYAQSGDPQEAKKILGELLELSKTQHVSPKCFATCYLGLEDEKRMFEWLQRIFEEHNAEDLADWRFDRLFAKYRNDPRYLELLRKMKLEDSTSSKETTLH